MKNSSRKVLAAAAMAGLLSGAALQQGCSNAKNPSANADAKPAPGKLASVKLPAVHGCGGENDCKGLGGCTTDDHKCKFKNDCKGKGGCALSQKDIDDWQKLQQAAAK